MASRSSRQHLAPAHPPPIDGAVRLPTARDPLRPLCVPQCGKKNSRAAQRLSPTLGTETLAGGEARYGRHAAPRRDLGPRSPDNEATEMTPQPSPCQEPGFRQGRPVMHTGPAPPPSLVLGRRLLERPDCCYLWLDVDQVWFGNSSITSAITQDLTSPASAMAVGIISRA